MPEPAVSGATTVLDSILFRDSFGTPRAARDLLRPRADRALRRSGDRARARRGALRRDSGGSRGRRSPPRSNADAFDFDLLRQETEIVGYPILPVVHQMAKQCGEAGRYVHWGATTQDIMDTAVVLQMRDALALVEADIDEVRAHPRATSPSAIATRRWPAARTCSRRCRSRSATRPRSGSRCSTVMRSGCSSCARACWWASSPARPERWPRSATSGLEVQKALMEELGLGVPVATWHVARDGFAEAVNLLGLITGSLGKIAYDVMLMMQNEFGEVYEPFVQGRGASSTMPQKRNPDLERADARRRQGRAPARGTDARRDGARLRARDRSVACRVDRDSRKLRAHRRRAQPGEVHAGRADRGRKADAQESRSHIGPHRRRGRDDGARAAHRPAERA